MVAGTAVLQTEQGVNIDICRQIRKALIEAYIEILSLAGDFAVIQRRTNRRQDGLCADIIAKVGADPLRSAVGVAGRIDDARLCLSYKVKARALAVRTGLTVGRDRAVNKLRVDCLQVFVTSPYFAIKPGRKPSRTIS